jgi:uncharacterized protein (TIGR02145 family)
MKKMFFLMLTFLIMGAASMNAQVTIGSDNLPHSGAVLDLQSDNLGLKLPNVELSTDLTDFKLPVTSESTKEDAKGMYVYNTNATLGEGVYVWDGLQWILVKASPGEKSVTKIIISSENDKASVLPNGTLQLSAIISPSDASFPEITWGIDLGSGYATINQNGLLTAYQSGIVRVTATAKNGVNAILTVYVTTGTQPSTKMWNGTREYLTADFNGDIWMVENSMEGTPEATCYDGDPDRVMGYYYTKTTAGLPPSDPNAPCQSGWHLASRSEAQRLYTYLQTDGTLNGALDYWIGGENYAGQYAGTWGTWKTHGIWWITGNSGYPDVIASYQDHLQLNDVSNSRWLTVRCVKD